ncbi:MAG TPA: hypothetical protein VJJ83_04795 [Candidatus Babeliales bacterium]|nr:hypothetical protein [Candidatus Babeliales bacterium]
MSNLKTNLLRYGLFSLLLLSATPSFSMAQRLTRLTTQARQQLPTWLGLGRKTVAVTPTVPPQLCLPVTAGPAKSVTKQPTAITKSQLTPSPTNSTSTAYLRSLCQIAGTEHYFSAIEGAEYRQQTAQALADAQYLEDAEREQRIERELWLSYAYQIFDRKVLALLACASVAKALAIYTAP